MYTRIKAALQLFEDSTRKLPLINPADALLEIDVDGFTEYSAGRFRLLPTDPPLTIPLGSVAAVAVFALRVVGPAGVDVTINGQTPAREIRPPNPGGAADNDVSLFLETSADIVSISVAHPGPVDAEPVTGDYRIVGDV